MLCRPLIARDANVGKDCLEHLNLLFVFKPVIKLFYKLGGTAFPSRIFFPVEEFGV
jgi:hypothetical protein